MQNSIIKKVNETRQTVKTYSNKKISNNIWKQIEEAIYWSPTSFGFEPYRVLIIEKNNNALRQALKPLMWNQAVVSEADKLVIFISLKRSVFCSNEFIQKRLQRSAVEILQKTDLKEIKTLVDDKITMVNNYLKNEQPNGDEWAMKQAYIGLSFALFAAAILNVGSTPMEGFERNKVENLLLQEKLMSNQETVVVCAAFGYPKNKTAFAHYGSNKRVRDLWNNKFKKI